MQVRITDIVPVQPRFRPDIGEEYTVMRLYENSLKEKVFCINVNGSAVGVRDNDCEVTKK